MSKTSRSVKSVKKKKNRALIYKTLTDPKFRKELQENPASALGVRELSELNVKEIQTVLRTVREVEVKIGRLADELLCANDGCGVGIA